MTSINLTEAYLGVYIQEEVDLWEGEFDESYDFFDIILEYLVSEGYADTNKNAIDIMVNMSEEWRKEILDEAYVNWRKGKLSSGVSPRERALRRAASAPAKVRLSGGNSSKVTKAVNRSKKILSVADEMDSHTSFGGLVNKIFTPGLGNRGGASPRISHGEPNTLRHRLGRFRRTNRSQG